MVLFLNHYIAFRRITQLVVFIIVVHSVVIVAIFKAKVYVECA